MINKWIITGDTHSDFSRFYTVQNMIPKDELWGAIILGDSSVNYWLSNRDNHVKDSLRNKYPNIVFYFVRGNHEARPESLKDIKTLQDDNVKGEVYIQDRWPNIRYLMDGNEYCINNKKCLVIGGAYSVDKWYRLERGVMGGYSGWFSDEQLSQEERDKILEKCGGRHYDVILAHTCPLRYQPRDLFLSCVKQDDVDNSMELWLEDIIEACSWDKFIFGHYHEDRIIDEKVEMMFHGIKEF